jgi:hypothetical protein
VRRLSRVAVLLCSDWVQNVVAPEQGQNPGRVRDIFANLRKAEALLTGTKALPLSTFRDDARGIIAKLANIARGAVYTRTVDMAAGSTLRVWSVVEYKRVSVEVVAGGAPIAFTQSSEYFRAALLMMWGCWLVGCLQRCIGQTAKGLRMVPRWIRVFC